MTPAPLSIIILNFNGTEDTLECLESLLKAELGSAAVVLVDNGSTDGSAARLLAWNEEHKLFSQVVGGEAEATGWSDNRFSPSLRAGHTHTLMLSPDNLGFAGGNNLGTRLALARGGEEVLLLNNDTTVKPDFLVALRAAARQHPQAVLIPQIRLYHQPDRLWNCGGYLRWPGRKTYLYENALVKDLPTDELLPTTAAVIFHKVGSTLKNNSRKSEIFTLKRLVNLRTRGGRLRVSSAYVFYLTNLLRILISTYKVRPDIALARVLKVERASRNRSEVGKDLCVAYVRGEEIDL